MNRRECLRCSAVLAAAPIVLAIAACGDDANRPDGIHAPHTDAAISAVQPDAIRSGGSLMVTTNSEGHTHTWTTSRPAGVC